MGVEMVQSWDTDVWTPRRGSAFGCLRFIQVIISLQVLWEQDEQKGRDRMRTFSIYAPLESYAKIPTNCVGWTLQSPQVHQEYHAARLHPRRKRRIRRRR